MKTQVRKQAIEVEPAERATAVQLHHAGEPAKSHLALVCQASGLLFSVTILELTLQARVPRRALLPCDNIALFQRGFQWIYEKNK